MSFGPDIVEKTAAIARYHAGCLKTIGAQNVGLRDLRSTKKAALACDPGLLVATEEVFAGGRTLIKPPTLGPAGGEGEDDPHLEVWERIRELARKAAVEAHNKEVTYGAPLLVGMLRRADRIETVLAPLFMQAIEVIVEPAGAIEIRAKDEPPRFNPVVWDGAVPKGDADQILDFGLDAQADLSERWDLDRVRTLLNAIASVFPGLSPETPEGVLRPWPVRPPPSEFRDAEPELLLHEGAGVYLSNRASPYLLSDLERVGEEPELLLLDDRPLSILVSPPAREEQPELRSPDIDEVSFPFPSNESQRRVADALDKNRVVVVQGPPGNGKSLTIANLACHFVARGESVLVTSHKDQALTVVRDKLKETGLQFLYASLIGGTGAAKRELQGQIADVTAFAAAVNAATLRKQLTEIEARRSASGEEYRRLRDEFNERAEPEQQEAAELLAELESIATLPAADPVVERPGEAQRGLERLDQLGREHREAWQWLLETAAADLTDTSEEAVKFADFLGLQRARLEAARNDAVGSLVRGWHARAEERPEEIKACSAVIDEIEGALRSAMSEVRRDHETTTLIDRARSLAGQPELLGDCREHVRALMEVFAEARRLSEARNVVSADPVRRAEVDQQHTALGQFLRRRAARRWLEENAPGAAGLDREAVERWRGFWDRWSSIQTLADGLPAGLRSEVPDTYAPDQVAAMLAGAQAAGQLAEGIRTAAAAAGRTRLRLPYERLLSSGTDDELEAEVGHWRSALAALDADRRGDIAKAAAELAFARERIYELDRLIDEHDYTKAEQLLAKLEAAVPALLGLAERRQLLEGPTGQLTATVEAVESAAQNGADRPAFMGDLITAFDAHPKVVRLEEVRSGRSTKSLAEDLRELRERVLDDARRLLGLRIQDRIVHGFRSPRFLASLEAFRRAVRASAKHFERIEALKNSEEFDVSILTEVFPCWIMRPEEACRVFPLGADLFDVVIFDEASQCNPDQALPLFARARRVAIFGDEKQLSNEDLRRSLSAAKNEALLRQADLADLDRPRQFDQTRNSLLDLVSSRAQATIVLNEHFRCRPEIIAFSNDAFYGNSLRVMRDQEDDRGLGPPFLLREVTGVPHLGKSKVNPYEAELVVEELERRLDDPRYEGMSFGVLSLFRDQIEHIEELVEERVPRQKRERHRVICSTVDGFQGDERDVILYSWRFAPTSSPSILAFTNGEAGSQRTNVALTRARHQTVHFISAPVERFPQGSRNVTGFLHHAEQPEFLMANAAARVHHEPRDALRARVAALLTDAGFEVVERFIAGGISVDLKVADPDTRARIGVFVDSKLDPLPPATAVRRIDAQGLLERSGWTVLRIPAVETREPDEIVALVRDALAETGPRPVSEEAEPTHETIPCDVEPSEELELRASSAIAVEDRADYHWDAPAVEDRLHAGEDVFQSDFERQLYDRLVANPDLRVVPQWPSRDKFIDLVLTDRQGRRLAIEADGDLYHETQEGTLIPEDINRQELLEEAGWVFRRVRHSQFAADPERETRRVLEALAEQPVNPALATRVWAKPSVVATAGTTRGTPSLPAAEAEAAATQAESAIESTPAEPAAPAHPQPEAQPGRPVALRRTPSPPGPRRRGAPPPPAMGEARPLDTLPLDRIPELLIELVGEAGEMSDDQVNAAVAAQGLQVSSSRERLLRSFAWYARAKGLLIRLPGDDGWSSVTAPGPVPQICQLSIDEIADRAKQFLGQGVPENELFDRLIEIIAVGQARLPKPYVRAIGAAIWKVTHR